MLGVLDAGTWSEADRFLAQALTLHDMDLCPGRCGFYLDETSDQDGHHRVDRIVCGACAAVDIDQEDTKDEEKVPGELSYVVLDV